MSLQGLISGSECALPSNPLSQVLKHAEGDRSLQQDRIAGSSSTRLRHLPGTSSAALDHDLALARSFFESNTQAGSLFPSLQAGPSAQQSRLHHFNGGPDVSFQRPWAEMENVDNSRHADYEQIRTAGAWAAEFGMSGHNEFAGSSSQQNMNPRPEFEQHPYMSAGNYGNANSMSMYGTSQSQYQYGMNQGLNMFNSSPGFGAASGGVLVQDNGKGKGKEADFEAAFASAAASFNIAQGQSASISEVDEGTADLTETLRSTVLDDTKVGDESESDFQKYWDQTFKSDVPAPVEDMAKWEAQFNQMMNGEREDADLYNYGESMQNAWESGLGGFNEDNVAGEALKFDDEGLPLFEDYAFEPSNKYLGASTSTRSLLEEAKSLLEQNGSLSEAALLLEAAIQKGELGEGGYETWLLLGETRNMDEREESGMRALAEGVRRATEAGAAPAGMLSLAISYTNESFDRGAHTTLLRWLQARYPSMSIPEETLQSIKNSSWDSHNRITDLFLQVARSQHAQGTVDADIQIGLGVMFYTKGDFDRAKDCFETALGARPQDYLLWNRLGSCLSNGSKPEEALGAYREALNLRPTYTRAIYNVGVACLNIGAHKEAVEHFLSALAMQDSTGAEKSEQLWFTLRRALISMGRSDLADHAKSHANVDVFRNAGFDF